MKYKNTKTGFVFETNAKCEGADYILIEDEQPKEEKKAPEKKTTKKKEK